MEYPDYFYDITLPGFPGNKKYQKELAEAQKVFLSKIILAKRINLYKNDEKSFSKIDCNNYCNRELKKNIFGLIF